MKVVRLTCDQCKKAIGGETATAIGLVEVDMRIANAKPYASTPDIRRELQFCNRVCCKAWMAENL